MEDPETRRQRLKALRAAAEAAEPDTGANGAAPDEPLLKFRNYVVKDQNIEHKVVEAAQPPKYEEPEPEAHQALASPDEDVLLNVAPKKANWDLRRDVAKQLEKLERRTHRAMIEIMKQQEREKLEAEGGQAD